MEEDDFVVDSEAAENRARQADSESDIEAEEERAEAKVKKVRDELAEARADAKANLDGWQRAKADYVNALKRFEEEKKGAQARGAEKVIEALLPAYDALERAREHGEVPAGFQAIAKQLENAFASIGLAAVGNVGDAFDPNLHEAYGQDATGDQGADDTITAVLEQGYKLGDRVIRPAKVRVAHFG
ncbi:MAG TPA: nucleotide exchange factor GrpE [Candidatus Paceibacterota bacterium]